MERLFSLLIPLLLITAPLQAQDNWFHHFESAKNIAQYDHRLILVDFWASWCGPCLKMDADVWSDPEIQRQKTKFVPVKLDVDREPAITGLYRVNSHAHHYDLRQLRGNSLPACWVHEQT